MSEHRGVDNFNLKKLMHSTVGVGTPRLLPLMAAPTPPSAVLNRSVPCVRVSSAAAVGTNPPPFPAGLMLPLSEVKLRQKNLFFLADNNTVCPFF